MEEDREMLIFSKNKHVGIERIDNDKINILVIVMDTFYMGRVNMIIDIKELNILSIEGIIERSPNERCKSAVDRVNKLIGINIKKGITKTVDDIVGGECGCTKLANMVLEGCHAAIPVSYFLKGGKRGSREGRKSFLNRYPWLINSCIVFSKDSPFMKDQDAGIRKE
jgi:hypothetical protein